MTTAFEYEPDFPHTDQELRYDPNAQEQVFEQFSAAPPDEYFFQDGEWHFHGMCGRDKRGRQTLPEGPEGFRWGWPSEQEEKQAALEGRKITTCDRREMTNEEVETYQQRGLLPKEVTKWYIFFNPERSEIEEGVHWRGV